MAQATHTLKSWPRFFEVTLSGEKTFELRKYDRDFKVGDLVVLEEWDPETQEYTGNSTRFEINYVLLSGDGPWLVPGYCAFGISKEVHYDKK